LAVLFTAQRLPQIKNVHVFIVKAFNIFIAIGMLRAFHGI